MSQSISQLLSSAIKKIDRLDAELLLAHVLKQKREFIIAHPDFSVSWVRSYIFRNYVAKRMVGVPIAHITGHKEFFGFDFLVNRQTLIPRPETEILVEQALEHIQENGTLVDVGTGSGCIPISILKSRKANITAYATDISSKALTIAKKNASKHFVQIIFFKGNLLEPIISTLKKSKQIIITANLPYLTQEQFDEEPSIQYEPIEALVAQDKGLHLYKELLKQIQTMNNKNIIVFFEIDPSQSAELSTYIHTQFPNALVEVTKDGMHNDRVIKTSLTIDK